MATTTSPPRSQLFNLLALRVLHKYRQCAARAGIVPGSDSTVTWAVLESKALHHIHAVYDNLTAAEKAHQQKLQRDGLVTDYATQPQTHHRRLPSQGSPLTDAHLSEIANALFREYPVPPETLTGAGATASKSSSAVHGATGVLITPTPPASSQGLRPAAAGFFPPLLSIPTRSQAGGVAQPHAPQSRGSQRTASREKSAESGSRNKAARDGDESGPKEAIRAVPAPPPLTSRGGMSSTSGTQDGSLTSRHGRRGPPNKMTDLVATVPWATSATWTNYATTTPRGGGGSDEAAASDGDSPLKRRTNVLEAKGRDPWWLVVQQQKADHERELRSKEERVLQLKSTIRKELEEQMDDQERRKAFERDQEMRVIAANEAHHKRLDDDARRVEEARYAVSERLQAQLFDQLQRNQEKKAADARQTLREKEEIRAEMKRIRLRDKEIADAKRAEAVDLKIHALEANEQQQKERELRREKEKLDDVRHAKMTEKRLLEEEEKRLAENARRRDRQSKQQAFYAAVREAEERRIRLIEERVNKTQKEIAEAAEREAESKSQQRAAAMTDLRERLSEQIRSHADAVNAERERQRLEGLQLAAQAQRSREEDLQQKQRRQTADKEYRRLLIKQLEQQQHHSVEMNAHMSETERRINAKYLNRGAGAGEHDVVATTSSPLH